MGMNATRSLTQRASMADVARLMEKWRSAPTMREKYEIEDLFFRGYKIRELEETIHIVNICRVNTFGKSLADSPWEVIMNDGLKSKVTLVSEGKIGVESMGGQDSCQLIVECIESGNTYLITGEGYTTPQTGEQIQFTHLSYTLAVPITLSFPSAVHSPFWMQEQRFFHNGTLDVKPYLGTVESKIDNTTLIFLPNNKVEVQIRGFKDQYYGYHLNGYY